MNWPFACVMAVLVTACTALPDKEGLHDADGDGVSYDSDCDDSDASISPEASEVYYDGMDNDCDPATDDADADGDGFPVEDDCDDGNPVINPSASDTVDGTGTDQNCDGVDGTDADADGVASEASGGTDCDDRDSTTYPGALEICGDCVVNDCETEERAAEAECWQSGTVSLSGAGVRIAGEDPEDHIGVELSACDFDGDGLNDLLLGARSNDEAGVEAGAAYVVLSVGSLDSLTDLSTADTKLLGESAGDWLGTSVACVGDVDGDGLSDLLIGARYQDGSATDAGAAYIVSGTLALEQAYSLSLTDNAARLTGTDSYDYAGDVVADAGDYDGDGQTDIIIGADNSNANGGDSGAAYLLLGDGTVNWASGSHSLASSDGMFLGEAAGDYAGHVVSNAGDTDGDGLSDLIVGAQWNDPDADSVDAGAAYVVRGADDFTPTTMNLADSDAKISGETTRDHVGWAGGNAGDVDGDGLSDIILGAYQYDYDWGANGTGMAALMLSEDHSAGGLSGNYLLSEVDVLLIGENQNDQAGKSVAGVGDVDCDDFDDIMVSAHGTDLESAGDDAGVAYVLLAKGALASFGGVVELQDADVVFVGEAAGDAAGLSVRAAGDADRDGFSDLLIGASAADTTGTDAGAVYLIFGGGY